LSHLSSERGFLLPGQLSSPKGKPLSVSADDVLWLSRAVEAEGQPRDLVAQTLINRWAWLQDFAPGQYPTLQALVRAYAQPVNPRWYPQGDKFLESYAKAAPAAQPALMQRALNREQHHSTRVQFSPGTEAAVQQALRGPITLPAGALHYAAATVKRPDLPLLVPGVLGQTNSIWGESDGRGIGALYAFETAAGPTFRNASLLQGRPHAVLAFLFLTAGGLLGLRGLRGKRRK
jgi:hypothetical protein